MRNEIVVTSPQELTAGQFDFSRHAFRRVVERNISEQEIREAGATAEVIENYPQGKYSPQRIAAGFHPRWPGAAFSSIVCGVGRDEDRHDL